jgi:membrane fusion protein (multidrug efflux system)
MRYAAFLLAISVALGQETVPVGSKVIERKSRLPGEFLPYLSVELRARVPGFVEKVSVDRGSKVRKGDVLVELDAPEMKAQLAEARSKTQALEAQRAELEAKRVAAESTYQRTKTASATPGAVAGNEVIQAEKAVDAAKASIQALEGSIRASRDAAKAIEDLQAYLKITAPFNGVITERLVHPGALASASSGPLLRLEDNSRLRLVVAVPESDVGGIVNGARVSFTVPAFPGQPFNGVVARIPHSMDQKTRTMAVELDVDNARGLLAPGMFPEVTWPVRNPRKSLLVPPTAIVTTTERTFVIRANNGHAEWVDVRKGAAAGDLVEVFGPLKEADKVLRRGSDEIRNGTALK